ncbi:MAG: hypothetical protein IJH48_02085 [Oscillospiraceae bacterium]|nr:hypothetical protein [Oscillospiraceae bacterium]
MKQILYAIVGLVASFHDRILTLNDSFPAVLSDKQLHFLVIGIFGMLLFFAVHSLFLWLVRRGHLMAISWIYVFTVILVLTFAIEIGQHITHTGVLEFADIVYGVIGFLIFFGAFAAARSFVMMLFKLSDRKKAEKIRQIRMQGGVKDAVSDCKAR